MLAGVLAGPLLLAGVAKLSTPAAKLPWPVRTGPLRAPHGPRSVGAAEVVAAALVVLLPGVLAAAVAAVGYGLLTGVAWAFKGSQCGCFGFAALADVGNGHVGANASAVAFATVLVFVPPGSGSAVRAGAAVVAALVTAAVLLAARRARDEQTTTSTCDEQVSGVVLYVSDGCPSCRSLKHLLETTVEQVRRDAVTMVAITDQGEVPEDMRRLGVPSAVGTDADGRPVCPPVSGVGPVKALVDRITVGAGAVPREC
ncbi:hypothetical protein [Saccharothrix algeriensis]|uniref:Methylamine utilization protein MauE n=1 Tax=Saccharothrix algeriensis TaxID=173560 RepID=A0ABS2SEK3_9PSEU|nr:hypothetical protein [Saccharothrix algeriensis]MBM7814697.1 hypothetical protein [Saccharothrix algeriensis]